jgi:hypothetical protein
MEPIRVASPARIAAFALALALTACGTVGSTKLDIKSTETRIFEFQDQRPTLERETSRTKQGGTVLTRLGDDRINPSGPALLRAWLHNKAPATLDGKRVVLTEFLVLVYEPPVRAFDGTENAGLVGLLVGHGIAAAKSPKTVRVHVSGTVDGKEFSAIGLENFTGRVQENEINSVITQALDVATTKIAEILAGPADNGKT